MAEEINPKTELNNLQLELLKTITRCSIYPFETVKYVYSKTNSYDKTIEVLKCALQLSVPVGDVMQILKIKQL